MRDGGGTRLKILDALAMGKAIVSTRIGCEGIEVVDGRDVMLAESKQDFLMHIRTLFENPILRQRLGHAGRRLAETRYSWEVIGKALNIAYGLASRSRLGGRNEGSVG
jgi:glycosyltransferase involved in cell wall biosynthesis